MASHSPARIAPASRATSDGFASSALLSPERAARFGGDALRNNLDSVRSAKHTRSVANHLSNSLRLSLGKYQKSLRKCRKTFSEKAVHNLRIATRKLLAQFALLTCIVPREAPEKAERLLKRRLRALSELRDVQVQVSSIKAKLPRHPEAVILLKHLKRRRRRLAAQAAKEVRREGVRKISHWIESTSEILISSNQREPRQIQILAKALKGISGVYSHVARRKNAIDPAHPRTIHETRIAFKKFRYMVESIAPLLPEMNSRRLARLALYQRKMGDIHDLEVVHNTAVEFCRHHPRQAPRLKVFCDHLLTARDRAIQGFLKHANDLDTLWPQSTPASAPTSPRVDSKLSIIHLPNAPFSAAPDSQLLNALPWPPGALG